MFWAQRFAVDLAGDAKTVNTKEEEEEHKESKLLNMEEIAAPTQKQAETRNNEAKGNLSSNLPKTESVDKPPDKPEAGYNRLKLFDKVMQKSLEKFIEHAR